uniref:Nuclear transcription factor Y subunit gamma n=1 Tax=Angiostrongylus cantonensis TaxID=6313 RepID=A0A0K0DAI2_ANGCA
MISSDAPLLLAAASEMFIQELTLRAWQLVEEGRRKTLQKSDIAAAASRFEHFDFLIDIVPREDTKKVHVSSFVLSSMGVKFSFFVLPLFTRFCA